MSTYFQRKSTYFSLGTALGIFAMLWLYEGYLLIALFFGLASSAVFWHYHRNGQPYIILNSTELIVFFRFTKKHFILSKIEAITETNNTIIIKYAGIEKSIKIPLSDLEPRTRQYFFDEFKMLVNSLEQVILLGNQAIFRRIGAL